MKITLVYPRTKNIKGGMSYPLGILYIATWLRKHGIDCDILDLTFLNWGDFRQKLMERKPDVVGFSIATPIADLAFKIIEKTKVLLPSCKIVVGGPHPTVSPIRTLKNKYIDTVVIGEGEKTMLRLLEQGKDLKKGIFVGELIENLDELPFPEEELIDIKKYLEEVPVINLITSRGCPRNCFFCQPTQRKLFGTKVRRRTPENVITEIKSLVRKYGTEYRFYFLDDCFTFDRKWITKFCDLVKDIGIEWRCPTRVDLVDKEVLTKMKMAGCIGIGYGVESGSQKILNFMRKGITLQQIKKAFKLTHKYGMFAHAFIMVGSPTETKQDLELTNKLIKEIHPDGIQISITTPLIGTGLYSFCKEKDILNIKSFSDYHYCMNQYPIKLKNLTQKDLVFYKGKFLSTWRKGIFRNIPKYVKMFIKSKNRRIFWRSVKHLMRRKY